MEFKRLQDKERRPTQVFPHFFFTSPLLVHGNFDTHALFDGDLQLDYKVFLGKGKVQGMYGVHV